MTLLTKPIALDNKITVEVLADRCAGCQECFVRCPTAAISFDSENWIVAVDDALCVGCRQCERTCPFSAILVTGEPLVASSVKNRIPHYLFPAVGSSVETRMGFSTFDDAQLEANRCLECPDPTCVRGCPAHNDIPAMIAALRDGELSEARSIFERTSHLGSICSRVCDQSTQCEGACSWTLAGETPVAIGLLERFVFDNTPIGTGQVQAKQDATVAIIGSGPAAMASAWELVLAGINVDVFEAQAKPGGLLNHAIPEFTLPTEKVTQQWEALEALGVKLHLNHRVTTEELKDLRYRYDGMILAHGAQSPIRPPIPGINSSHVMDAMDFLNRTGNALHHNDPLSDLKGKTIMILGAGNTAMDVGRMAIRFGAIPTAVEWVNEAFSRVRSDELAEARNEGVEVSFLTTISEIRDNAVTLVSTRHTDPASLPKLIKSSEREIKADIVVLALGYRLTGEFDPLASKNPYKPNQDEMVDLHWVASGLFNHSHNPKIGLLSWRRDLATQHSKIPVANHAFVAGDALIGQSTVVEAMAQGRESARQLIATLSDTHA